MSEPAILYFTAPWCAPCKKYLPIVQKEAAKAGVGDEVQLINIDTPEGGAMAAQHGIKSVPTLAFVGPGTEPAYYAGPRTAQWLRESFTNWVGGY